MRGLINIQYALGSDVLYVLEANPRASPHGAVRLQGDRDAAGQGGRPGDAGRVRSPSCARPGCCPPPATAAPARRTQPIAVKEAVMPFNRFRDPDGRQVDTVLGPGDEVHRRGDGPRRRLRHGLRQVPGRGLRLAPLPSKGRGRVFVSHGQPRQAHDDLPDQGAGRPRASRSWPPRAPPRCCAATACDATVVRKHFEGPGPDGEPHHRAAHPRRRDRPGRQHPARRRRAAARPRLDGYEIRTAAVMANIPCITTVQGLGAAVQGIEAARSGADRGAVAPGLGSDDARSRRRDGVTYDSLFDHGPHPRRPRAGPPRSASGRSGPLGPVAARGGVTPGRPGRPRWG